MRCKCGLPPSAASVLSPRRRPITPRKTMVVANRAAFNSFQREGIVLVRASSSRYSDSSDASIPESLFCLHWVISAREKLARSSIIV